MAGRRSGGSRGGGGGGFETLLHWPAWALALVALGSAFGPLPRDWVRVAHWALFLFALIEAGVTMAQGRRNAFLAYAALAVLVNPFQPFHFPPQAWRLLYAGAGLWLAADHLPRRG